MTVGDLIKALEIYEKSLPVVTKGFDEAEYDDITTIKVLNLDMNKNEGLWHVGSHEESKGGKGQACIFIDF